MLTRIRRNAVLGCSGHLSCDVSGHDGEEEVLLVLPLALQPHPGPHLGGTEQMRSPQCRTVPPAGSHSSPPSWRSGPPSCAPSPSGARPGEEGGGAGGRGRGRAGDGGRAARGRAATPASTAPAVPPAVVTSTQGVVSIYRLAR